MKAIMLMFDSLNRAMLPPYGCDWVKAPNFTRLAGHSVRFDRCYAGSLPCMPARRELHTGRYNFLHRSWSPIEPYDDSVIEMLGDHGIYTHLITDHVHYWEDGGATYHTRYSSFEFFRGQEGDKWKGVVQEPDHCEHSAQKCLLGRPNAVNRQYMRREAEHSQTLMFDAALEFLDTNKAADHWFLQIEAFDPHEPFFTYERYRELYDMTEAEGMSDWPDYGKSHYTAEQADFMRNAYGALVSMCDANLGRLLDKMDAEGLWEDTLLIVNTDHGILLGEHGYWGKNSMPCYEEIAHIPLFVWDPRSKKRSEGRSALVQTIDLPVTLLDYFGIAPTADMQGKSLRTVLEHDTPVREGALFGIYGGHVGCTDGDHIYLRGAATEENQPLYQYTLMPVHMMGRFCTDELKTLQLAGPFTFTKGCRLLRTDCRPWGAEKGFAYGLGGYLYPDLVTESLLFNVKTEGGDQDDHDPSAQQTDSAAGLDPSAAEVTARMKALLLHLMEVSDAPIEQYVRLGLRQIG